MADRLQCQLGRAVVVVVVDRVRRLWPNAISNVRAYRLALPRQMPSALLGGRLNLYIREGASPQPYRHYRLSLHKNHNNRHHQAHHGSSYQIMGRYRPH